MSEAISGLIQQPQVLLLTAPDTVDLRLAKPASFTDRATAFSLDQVLIACIMLWIGITGTLLLRLMQEDFHLTYIPLFAWAYFLVDGAYYTFMHGYSGQTVGKIIMGIRVIRADGTPLSYPAAFQRWIFYCASSMTLGIGYLQAIFTENNQALHDMLAETVVVETE